MASQTRRESIVTSCACACSPLDDDPGDVDADETASDTEPFSGGSRRLRFDTKRPEGDDNGDKHDDNDGDGDGDRDKDVEKGDDFHAYAHI